MPLVLVSDTSVLVDLHRGAVLEIALRLPYEFAVPDLLFERELRDWEGLALEGRLTILPLDGGGVELAAGYRRADTRLSLPDAFALALAKLGRPHAAGRRCQPCALAETERVECHSVLWVLDGIARCELAPLAALHAALAAILAHPRCRLPRSEIKKRLDAWGQNRRS